MYGYDLDLAQGSGDPDLTACARDPVFYKMAAVARELSSSVTCRTPTPSYWTYLTS